MGSVFKAKQVSMDRIGRVEKDCRCSGGIHGRHNLAGHQARFPHSRDHNPAFAFVDHVHRSREPAVDLLLKRRHSGRFDPNNLFSLLNGIHGNNPQCDDLLNADLIRWKTDFLWCGGRIRLPSTGTLVLIMLYVENAPARSESVNSSRRSNRRWDENATFGSPVHCKNWSGEPGD